MAQKISVKQTTVLALLMTALLPFVPALAQERPGGGSDSQPQQAAPEQRTPGQHEQRIEHPPQENAQARPAAVMPEVRVPHFQPEAHQPEVRQPQVQQPMAQPQANTGQGGHASVHPSMPTGAESVTRSQAAQPAPQAQPAERDNRGDRNGNSRDGNDRNTGERDGNRPQGQDRSQGQGQPQGQPQSQEFNRPNPQRYWHGASQDHYDNHEQRNFPPQQVIQQRQERGGIHVEVYSGNGGRGDWNRGDWHGGGYRGDDRRYAFHDHDRLVLRDWWYANPRYHHVYYGPPLPVFVVGDLFPPDIYVQQLPYEVAEQLPAIPYGYQYVLVGDNVLLLDPYGTIVDIFELS